LWLASRAKPYVGWTPFSQFRAIDVTLNVIQPVPTHPAGVCTESLAS
jgi:hypothetical protein